MAGGRRPASYVSGARHNAGVERAATTFDNPTSPPAGAVPGTSLPPWIPSIWQPAPAKPPPSSLPDMIPVPPRDPSPLRPDPSSALAAALDSAVQSAVVRALESSAPGTTPPSPHMQPCLPTSENNSEEACRPEAVWSLREMEMMNLIDTLQQRLDKKDKDVQNLSERLLGLERKIAVDADVANHREKRISAEVSTHVRKVSDSLARAERHIDSRLTVLQEQSRANQSGLANVRGSLKSCEQESNAASKRAQELSRKLSELDINISAELQKLDVIVSTELQESRAQVEQLGQSFNAKLSKVNGTLRDESPRASEKETAELKRSVEASSESVAAIRGKLKRVESQMKEVAKQSNDMMALNSGFEETMRDNLMKVTSVIEGLRATVAQLQDGISSQSAAPAQDEAQSRLDNLESNLKSLKKLIESNLRTQWNAESIVKEQVSLITKHVCVAMRQYTARRISENNALIDQALRARIPEYAKNEDQFVLVREQDMEGNESVDIQRTSEVSSNASS